MPNPYVIITIGPTGAGKSGLLTETIKHCNLEDLRPEHIFRVDDLVTAKKSYKEAVDKITQPAFQSIPLNKGFTFRGIDKDDEIHPFIDSALDSELNQTSTEFMENMGKAYMTSRKEKGCNLLNYTFDGLDNLLLPDNNSSSREIYYKIRTKFIMDKISKTTENIENAKKPTAEEIKAQKETKEAAEEADSAAKEAAANAKEAKTKAKRAAANAKEAKTKANAEREKAAREKAARAANAEQEKAEAEAEKAEAKAAQAEAEAAQAEAAAKVKAEAAKVKSEAAAKAVIEKDKLQKELDDLNEELQEKETAELLENNDFLTPEEKTDPALKKYDCVKFNDLRIIRAISQRLSFSFEITGEFFPKHYFTWFKIAKELKIDYDIYISCVLVSSFTTLVERNQKRYMNEYFQYSTDKDNINMSAPRLPPITHILDENIKKIIKNIKKMYEEYFHKDPIIARFLVYSNNDTLTLKFEAISQIAELNRVLSNLYMNTQIIPKTNPNISLLIDTAQTNQRNQRNFRLLGNPLSKAEAAAVRNAEDSKANAEDYQAGGKIQKIKTRTRKHNKKGKNTHRNTRRNTRNKKTRKHKHKHN
jgi:chemotaxis protein histidine kinase CheA